MPRPASRVLRLAHRPGRPARAALLMLLAALLAVLSSAGCASFPDTGPRRWHDKPPDTGPLMPPPGAPDQPSEPAPKGGGPSQEQPNPDDKPNGCDDPDPLVVATCLNPVSAIAVLPGGQSALVAERDTGRILQVEKGRDPKLIATLAVDPGNGGLIGLVLSPAYDEDRLLYAYVGTPSDHRVVRVATGGEVVPILSGIPRTSGNDSGALGVGPDGALLVATGTGNTAEAPDSMAGKILRIDTFGRPMPDNPAHGSPIYSRGLQSPEGLCTSPTTRTVWVTDRLTRRDVLYRVAPGQMGEPVWNWPDRPGVGGCAATDANIAVAETGNAALFVLQTIPKTDNFTGLPSTSLEGRYGKLRAVTIGPAGVVWFATVNKGSGGPLAPSDDRVIRLPLVAGGPGGAGPD